MIIHIFYICVTILALHRGILHIDARCFIYVFIARYSLISNALQYTFKPFRKTIASLVQFVSSEIFETYEQMRNMPSHKKCELFAHSFTRTFVHSFVRSVRVLKSLSYLKLTSPSGNIRMKKYERMDAFARFRYLFYCYNIIS